MASAGIVGRRRRGRQECRR